MFGSKKPLSAAAPTAEATRQPAAAIPSAANGAAAGAAPVAAPRQSAQPVQISEAQRKAAAAQFLSMAFTQMVFVFMNSKTHRQIPVGDLERLVMPALLTGQFRVGEVRAQKDGPSTPVTLITWASVSPEVDARLSAIKEGTLQLKPNEWKSGDQIWIVDVIGDMRTYQQMIQNMRETVFKGRRIKIRVAGQDSQIQVHTLEPVA